MKRLASILIACTLSLLLPAAHSQCPPNNRGPDKLGPGQRATAVEHNLAPMYVLEGHPAVQSDLRQRMADLHVPGVTIAALCNGKLDWARGYGVLELGGAPVTPQTLFAAESMSKPITALAVLTLYDQGKVDLDRNVNVYLKRWKLPESSFPGAKTVTVRQLLTHTSGIGTHNGELYDASKPLPTLLNDLGGAAPSRTPAVRIEDTPGRFHYANGGYEVLQLLIEDVTGERFDAYVRSHVLQPAGMTSSTYDVPRSAQLARQAATAYLGDHAIPPGKYYNPNAAAGGLWSTPSDLVKLLLELQREYDGKSSRILRQSTMRQMLTPGPQMMPGRLQGLGFIIGGKPGSQFIEHGGSGIFQDDMVAYIQGGQDGLVVMTSSSSAGVLVDEILRSASLVYNWPDYRQQPHAVIAFDASTRNKYIGDFGPVRFVASPTGIAVEMPAGNVPEQVYTDRPGHFFVLGGPQEFTFSDEADGRMRTVHFVTPMASLLWQRH